MTRINSPPNQETEDLPLQINNNNNNNNNTTSYIIDTNKRLYVENKKLEKEISVLTEKLESLEDDIGRTEKTNIHLKGLLKNFQAISEYHEKISDSRKIICIQNENDVFEFSNDIKFIRELLMLFGFGVILYMYACYIFGYIDLFTTLFTSCVSIMQACITNPCTKYKLPKQEKIELAIKSFEKEIYSIQESLDFITEYIDSI